MLRTGKSDGDRIRRVSRRRASICFRAAFLALLCSCRWSTDPADVTPLSPDDAEVASVDQVLTRTYGVMKLVPDQEFEVRFGPKLPVMELDGSVSTYRLLIFDSPAEQRFRILVRSLQIIIDPPNNGFVVPRIAVYGPDGSRLQTLAEYELVSPGLWNPLSLRLQVEGIVDAAGPCYVVLATVAERIGEELWLLENPAEPGRAIVDWSEPYSSNVCSLAGDLRVQLQFLDEPDAAGSPDTGGAE